MIIGTLIVLISKLGNKNLKSYIDDVLGEIVPAVVTGFMFGCTIWFLIGMTSDLDTIVVEKEKRSLVSLKDNTSVSGGFFLGIGTSMNYYGYEDLGNNRFQMVTFSSNNVIVEDVPVNGKAYFVRIASISDPNDKLWEYDKWMIGPFARERTRGYEIHIPKGSILKNEYKLDLE